MFRINQAAVDEAWGELHQELGRAVQVPKLVELEQALARRALVAGGGEFAVTNALSVPAAGGLLTAFDGGYLVREETAIASAERVAVRVEYRGFLTGLLLAAPALKLPALLLKAGEERDETARRLGLRPLDFSADRAFARRLCVFGRGRREALAALTRPVRRLLARAEGIAVETARGAVLVSFGRSLPAAKLRQAVAWGAELAGALAAALRGEHEEEKLAAASRGPGRPAKAAAAPKKRGRPAKVAGKRGPGRPRKAATPAFPAKRGPGRPPKVAGAPKKRGRPAKAAGKRGPGRPPKVAGAPKKLGRPARAVAAPKKRGRPAKVAGKRGPGRPPKTAAAPKKRGRPAKAAAAPKKRGRPAKKAGRGPGRPPKAVAAASPAKRGPGRPPKAPGAPKKRGRPAKVAGKRGPGRPPKKAGRKK